MHKITASLSIVLLLMLLATGSAWAQDAVTPQASAGGTVPCTMPLPPTEIEGETIVCGEIVVPEDWDNPASTPITITYAVQLSTSKSPFADPVIYFTGGPGASLLSAIGHSKYDFSFLRDKRDVIIFDQRGNRYSSDLRCPEEVRNPDTAARQAAIDAYPFFDFTADSDPAEAIAHSVANPRNEYLPACAAWFADQGIDLREYNTANTVLDSIALMDHLGYPTYNLFGISYGTQIVQQILDYYTNAQEEELPGVRAALMDGVVPLNIPAGFLQANFNVALGILRHFGACEADEACGAAYPNIRGRVIDLLAGLEETPLMLADGTQIGAGELSTLFSMALFLKRGDIISLMPRIVAELEAGETAAYGAAGALLTGAIPTAPPAAATPFEPLNAEVAGVAAQLRGLAAQLDEVGSRSLELQQALATAETLPDLYMLLMRDSITTMVPDERDALGASLLPYIADVSLHTRQALVDLTKSLPGTIEKEQMISVVEQMSDAEVAEVFATALTDDFVQPLVMTDDFVSLAILCNDRIAYTSIEEFQQLLRDFEAPQLVTDTSGLANNIASCALFGLGEPDGTPAPVGVSSDVTTLVFNGMLDLATPIEWHELAIPNLTDVRVETFPMAAHGATRYSDCAKDIAAAFFTYPERAYDASCIAELQPPFVLADDVLPAVMPE